MIHRHFWRGAAALAWVWLCPVAPAHAIGGYHPAASSPTSDNGAAVRFVAGGSALVDRALADLGKGNFTRLPGAWCAWATSAWLEAIGKPRLPNGLAASALSYGPHVVSPQPGDLAVLPHHVGIVVEDRGGEIVIVSGNWSHRVAVAAIPRRTVRAFVRT